MKDIRIDPTAKIKYSTEFGNHIAIGYCVYIAAKIKLGDYCHIAPFVSIIGGKDSYIEMGNFSNLAAGVRIICNSDDFINSLGNPIIPTELAITINNPVILEGYNLVGTNSIIMPGVTMAIGSACGAGSIMTKNTEPWTFYMGDIAIKLRNKEQIIKYAKELGYEF